MTFAVPRGTAPGTHAGRVVFSDGRRDYAEVRFTLRVSAAEALSWEDPAAFKITIPVQVGPYVEFGAVQTDDSASSAWSTSSASWPSTT